MLFDTLPPPVPPAYFQCYLETAVAYTLPMSLLPGLVDVEGGKVGESVCKNSDGSCDHGLTQINDFWIAKLSQRFQVTREMVRDDPCVAIRAAGYIVRYEINEAGGDFWKGVGRYHSRNAVRHANYVRKVFSSALKLAPVFEAWVSSYQRAMVVGPATMQGVSYVFPQSASVPPSPAVGDQPGAIGRTVAARPVRAVPVQ